MLALATDGTPSFWAFVVLMGAVLFAHQMLIPDLNAAAMRPLAHVAGTAAAILGMVPGVVGSVIGWMIDRQFDGTILPLAIAYVVGTAVAIAGWWWAVVATRRSDARRSRCERSGQESGTIVPSPSAPTVTSRSVGA